MLGVGSIASLSASPFLPARIASPPSRPPESYCLLKGSDGQVYWRDSHRRKQYDFATMVRVVARIGLAVHVAVSPSSPRRGRLYALKNRDRTRSRPGSRPTTPLPCRCQAARWP